MPVDRPLIIGHHLIWTLYGHWLANDLRGSGSEAVRDPKFAALGEVHRGRKPEHLQPSRAELREFYREARPLLNFAPFWLDESMRQAVAEAVGEIVRRRPYTVWACAVLANHMHLVVRRHSDDAIAIWNAIAEAAGSRLREFRDIADGHPVWAARPYKVYLRMPQEVRSRVAYVERNPEKEGLPRQKHEFVARYDGWPFNRRPR
jgi:REP element-mobilizing transposase RayT